ncbi:hypothetical protein [Lentzea sp. NPDC055074]
MRKAFTVLGALAMLLAVVAPARADVGAAAFSCSGSNTYTGSAGGVGQLKIFYSSANGGTNTACYYHIGAAAGVPAQTYVLIERCAETSGEGVKSCTTTALDEDGPGDWSKLAGPVGVVNTARVCVRAYGFILWNGVFREVDSGRQGCPN